MSTGAVLPEAEECGTPRAGNAPVTKRWVTAADARAIASRYNSSHFHTARDTGEKARYSIPAEPERDDDFLLRKFIYQHEQLEAELATLRAPVSGCSSCDARAKEDARAEREVQLLRALTEHEGLTLTLTRLAELCSDLVAMVCRVQRGRCHHADLGPYLVNVLLAGLQMREVLGADFGAVPEHDIRVELWQRSGCWSVVTLHPRRNKAGELDWYVVGQPAHHLGLPESLLAERMAIGSALGHVEGVLGARACAARAIHEERSARR